MKSSISIKYKFCKPKYLTYYMGLDERSSKSHELFLEIKNAIKLDFSYNAKEKYVLILKRLRNN